MSRLFIDLDDHRTLVFGDDPSFNTLYAAIYRDGDEDDVIVAAGYHPVEQKLTPEVEHEPDCYPLDIGGLDLVLVKWDVGDDVRDEVGRMLAQSGYQLF